MAPLTARRRANLPKAVFALPGRRYPIDTRARAGNALARVSQYGTPYEQAQVHRAVCRRFNDMPSCERKK